MRKLQNIIVLLHLSIRYFIWCTTRYTMRQTHVLRKVTWCTKLWSAQHSPELALRRMDFCAPENLIFLALSNVAFPAILALNFYSGVCTTATSCFKMYYPCKVWENPIDNASIFFFHIIRSNLAQILLLRRLVWLPLPCTQSRIEDNKIMCT